MRVFTNDIKEIKEKDIEILKSFFRGFEYRGAGYTFISHYIWKDSYCVSWEIINGYLCLAGTKCGKEDGESFMPMPLIMKPEDKERLIAEASDRGVTSGSVSTSSVTLEAIKDIRTEYEPKSLRIVILECEKRFFEAGRPLCLSSIPGHMLDLLREAFPADGEIEFIHDEDYDEYHLNSFLRNYEYEAKSIRDVDREEILALAAEIRDYKAQDEDEVEDIESEYAAIVEILNLLAGEDTGNLSSANSANSNNIQMSDSEINGEAKGLKPCGNGEGDDCPIYGVGIYIKGKLEAFAIGEVISETMAAEHFEKANDEFRGLYQLVCREFCKQLPESIIYVNREEDMGLPGLRQAKSALKPEHMEERYTAEISFDALKDC